MNSRQFLGIPYAAPPIKSLRWADPVRPVSWQQVLNTTQFGPGCPQQCILPPHTCPEKMSEDCLTVNVFAPLLKNLSKPVPVMIFIHGGHFDQGYSGALLYEAQRMVEDANIVVVTFNYRLGVLGFLATRSGLKGNYAFQDQLFLLRWVQDNIKFFGGNPQQVTLSGQSAGGASVRAHLVSPVSRGLFHRAILQSDPLGLPMMDPEEMYEYANFYMAKIGCENDEQCLRAKNSDDLVTAQKEFVHMRLENIIQFLLPYTFIVSKDTLPIRWEKALSLGLWNKMPLLIGSAAEDGLMFVCEAINNSKLGPILFSAAAGIIYKADALSVLSKYPPSLSQDNKNQFSTLITDYLFHCPSRYVMANLPRDVQMYHYVWNHAMSFDGWGPRFHFCIGRVCHGSELAFEFYPYPSERLFNITAQEKILSQQWRRYLINFVRTSNPNMGLPVTVTWPPWNASQHLTMILQTPENKVLINYREDECNYWDSMTGQSGFPYLYGFRDLNETSLMKGLQFSRPH